MWRGALLLVAVVTFAGCGSSHTGGALAGDKTSIRSVVVSVLKATARGDGAAACALMTPNARHQTAQDARRVGAGTTCAEGIAEVTRRLTAEGIISAVKHSTVTAVQISGDRATATVKNPQRTGQTYLRKINGGWLVANGRADQPGA